MWDQVQPKLILGENVRQALPAELDRLRLRQVQVPETLPPLKSLRSLFDWTPAEFARVAKLAQPLSEKEGQQLYTAARELRALPPPVPDTGHDALPFPLNGPPLRDASRAPRNRNR